MSPLFFQLFLLFQPVCQGAVQRLAQDEGDAKLAAQFGLGPAPFAPDVQILLGISGFCGLVVDRYFEGWRLKSLFGLGSAGAFFSIGCCLRPSHETLPRRKT